MLVNLNETSEEKIKQNDDDKNNDNNNIGSCSTWGMHAFHVFDVSYEYVFPCSPVMSWDYDTFRPP